MSILQGYFNSQFLNPPPPLPPQTTTPCPLRRGRYLYDNGGLAKLHKDEAQCKSCEAGKYSNVTSAQTCSQCSSIDEFLYSSEGSTGCMECHKHYYRTSVIECHQDGSSTTSCDEASAVANCTKCPTGLDCGKPNSKLESLDLEAQYWRAGPKATKIYKCHDSVQCPGKRNSTDEYCGKGYRGPLCSICRNSFFKTYSSMCERCSPLRILASTSAWIVALVSILMLLPMLIVRRFGGLSNLRASMGSNITHVDWWLVALRITYFKIQVISQYSEVQHVNWPKPFQFTVDVMSAVSLNFAKWWTANSCLIPYDAFAYVRIATLTPLLMALATFAVFAARAVGGLRERMKKAWTRGRKIFTQAMDIIHTLICCLIFQTFECKRFENVGEDDEVQKYLKSDLQQVNCSLDNPYYRAFYIYAVVMVVVYVGIIPVVMLLDKRENRERDFSSGLLWLNPYKEKFWSVDRTAYFYCSFIYLFLSAFTDFGGAKRAWSLFIVFYSGGSIPLIVYTGSLCAVYSSWFFRRDCPSASLRAHIFRFFISSFSWSCNRTPLGATTTSWE
jgi:hypothetical protein